MSIIASIKQKLGLSVIPANNFTWDASADNGTLKLERGDGQSILTVDANGKPDFNQLTKTLGNTGAIDLPGNITIQWGRTVSTAGYTTASFSKAFGAAPYVFVGTAASASSSSLSVVDDIGSATTTGVAVAVTSSANAYVAGTTITWIAIGRTA